MIIKFKEMEEKIIDNFLGGEKSLSVKMFNDEKNKIMYGKLIPHASIGYHCHETSSEILFILKGNGQVLYENELFDLKENQCHYCEKGKSHSLINNSEKDLIFFAVVPIQ